nr:hypothetical protein [Kitasatospora fiedleri]
MGSGADRLQDAGRDQPAEARREGAGQRGEGEEGDPGEEHRPLAQPVPEPPGDDQERREDDGVGVEDPGEGAQGDGLALGRAERGAHGGQGHVDDPQVQVGHEDRQQDHRRRHMAL